MSWLADKEQKTTAVIGVAIPADRNIREEHEDILFIIKDDQIILPVKQSREIPES